MKYFSTKSIRQTNAIVSVEPHIYDLDRDKIIDLDKFLKKPHNIVLS